MTNPSIVAAPDQTDVPDGWLSVIVSVRAVGEGHPSSIELRTGRVGPDGEIGVGTPAAPINGHRRSPMFEKELFAGKSSGGVAGRPCIRSGYVALRCPPEPTVRE